MGLYEYDYEENDYFEYEEKKSIESQMSGQWKRFENHLENMELKFQELIGLLYDREKDISNIEVDNCVGEIYDFFADYIVMSKKMPAFGPTISRRK